MALYMLDTNIASAAMRGTAGLDVRLQRLDPADWCISAITHAEIRYGAALRPEAKKLQQYVNAFFAAAHTVSWDEAAADRHGQLRAELQKRGKSIGDFDEMIAAHALVLNAILVTDNVRHFKQVKGLSIENWIRNS